MFISGLVVFFVSYVFYIIIMLLIKNWWIEVVFFYLFLVIVIFCLFYLNLNDMFIFVFFYMLVFIIMVSLIWMIDKLNGLLVLGGVVFVILDFIFGLNCFYFEIIYVDIVIMCSYYLV